MLNLIITTLKSIIDLLHKRDENKKLRLESTLKEIELREKTDLIKKPSDAEIERYNPIFQAVSQKERARLQREKRSGGCFPKGTNITTPNGFQDISTLQKGDFVLSFNEKTNQTQACKILKKISHKNEKIWLIGFVDDSAVHTTSVHSFSINGKWKTARQIKDSDSIKFFDKDGNFNEKTVKDSRQTDEVEEVYNIVVESQFTFIADGVLAHSFTYFRTLRILGWSIYSLLVVSPRLFNKPNFKSN